MGATRTQAKDQAKTARDPQAKKISWEEFVQHNTLEDCWIAIRGKVYDVTEWVPKHPGGTDVLYYNAGRDGTQLFEAYHPISVYATLNKYYVGELERSEHPSFPPMSEFYITLKGKVEDYFRKNNLSPRYAPEMIMRTFALISLMLLFHYLSVITASKWAVSLTFAALTGWMAALISFMPVHEGSHASTGSHQVVWRALGAVHDFLNGASFFTWVHQHFLGHHPYTNVTDLDRESLWIPLTLTSVRITPTFDASSRTRFGMHITDSNRYTFPCCMGCLASSTVSMTFQ